MLKLIFYIIILVLVLSFFGVSLQHIVESPTTQSNFDYVLDLLKQGWNDILDQVVGLWHLVF